MVININIVLDMYSAVLSGKLSYSDADRWAWEMIKLFDNGGLEFEPREDENLIWQLTKYLYGIDMPCVNDRTKTIISDLDIIDFLKEKKVFHLLSA